MQKLQLSISEPCHENWQTMTPTDQGRFCNACVKEVIDFSMMTDTEMLNYFATSTHEKICGRALPSQLDRFIERPKEPKKRLFWYWNYIVMFFMFFGKSNEAKAQGNIKAISQTEVNVFSSANMIGDTVITKALCTKRSEAKPVIGKETGKIIGSIASISENGKVISIVDGVIVDGIPDLSPDDIGDVTILPKPTAIALYGSKGANGAIVITTRRTKEINLDTVIISSGLVLGRMTMYSHETTRIQVKDENLDNSVKTNNNGGGKKFTIYPNPVKRGSTITLALIFKQTGLHQIQITDATGRTVFYKRINTLNTSKNEVIDIDRRWGAGFYYLSVFDNKNKLLNKESFIVQ